MTRRSWHIVVAQCIDRDLRELQVSLVIWRLHAQQHHISIAAEIWRTQEQVPDSKSSTEEAMHARSAIKHSSRARHDMQGEELNQQSEGPWHRELPASEG